MSHLFSTNELWKFGKCILYPFRTVVGADVTLNNSDHLVNVDPDGADRKVFLPPVAELPGVVFRIKNIDTAAKIKKVIIQPQAGDLIDGKADHKLSKMEAATVSNDGVEWWVY